MLKPLFSSVGDLIAWADPDRYVFDLDMCYVAFIVNAHAWSASTGVWLGPVADGHLYDIEGLPVAWSIGTPVHVSGKPLRPVNVVRAISPVRPARPMAPPIPLRPPVLQGAWSPLTFSDWLVANDPIAPRSNETDLQQSENDEVK